MSESPSTPISHLDRNLPLDAAAVTPPMSDADMLPETVLQFGTGAFLRGFADAFLDQANRDGSYAGRVVMVGSTGSGRSEVVNRQDGLYTLCVQGLEEGRTVDHCTVIGVVSRALASQDSWREVLACARNSDMELVISNTTEVGIQYDADDRIDLDPPRSYPGKLVALLYERACAFEFDTSRGWIILCCELVERNGDRLREIVERLARDWGLGERFVDWIRSSVQFCNTLVDRIVPGRPDDGCLNRLFDRLGYHDELLVQAEPYRLWAIEGSEPLRQKLPFAAAEAGIVVTPDIRPFRERKVRILNGTHTLMVPVSLQCGNQTVRETMEHPLTSKFVRRVMLEEIVPTLDLESDETRSFAAQVLDRFANPFVRHDLIDITFQQTTKMRVRVLPSLKRYAEVKGELPPCMTFGFAAFLHFLVGDRQETPADERAESVRAKWSETLHDGGLRGFVREVCSSEELWGISLESIPEFGDRVAAYLSHVMNVGAEAALESMLRTAE